MPKAEFGDKIMPFGDHLEELRSRLLFAIMGLLPILGVSLYFGKVILGFLVEPVYKALLSGNQAPNLQVTNPFEVFSAYMKVSIVLSILVGAPWIVYQLWRFVAPGLYAHERRFAYLLAPLSAVLTFLSAVFLYYVMLPTILFFFVQFNASMPGMIVTTAAPAPEIVFPIVPVLAADPPEPALGAMWYNQSLHQLRVCAVVSGSERAIVGTWMAGATLISQQYRVADSVSLVLNLALALAIAFQMPVVVLLLGWAGIVTTDMLTKYRRHAVLICAVLGAVLTPADPLSMMLLAVPLYLLYELGVFLLRVLPAKRVAGEHNTGDADPFAKPDDE